MRKSLLTLLLFCLWAAPLMAEEAPAPSYACTDEVLETRLAPMKEEVEKDGTPAAAQQIYMRYAVAGHREQARAWCDRYVQLLTDKAEVGDSLAMATLGNHYLTGKDYTDQNIEQGVKWLYRAAEAGQANAAFILGDFLARQGNTAGSQDAYSKAYAVYAENAAKGDHEALCWQGFMQQNGLGTAQKTAEGIAKMEQAAAAGTSWAFSQLFKTYALGLGVEKDMSKAIAYARKAADETGDGMMAYATACAYLKGEGVEKDEATGDKYLDMAAGVNVPQAIYYKGLRLEQAGKGNEAYPYFRQGASMGNADCMVATGRYLLYGLGGVEQDEARGLSFLQAASDRWDSPRAPYELGLYYDGIGEKQTADMWYRIASDRGVAETYARRGFLHLKPFSEVEWNPTYAYQWWKAGKEAGDETCALYVNLFYYVFIPLLLLLVIGIPVLAVYLLNKKNQAE